MLRKISCFRQRADFTKKTMKKHCQYLLPGEYIFDEKYAYRKDPDTIKFVKEILLNNNYNLTKRLTIRNIIKKLIVINRFVVKEKYKNKSFKGSIFLFSNDSSLEKDIKIFNIEEKEVLSIYIEQENLTKKIGCYNFFKQYFKIPTVISYDYNKKISVEEFIESKPKKTWGKEEYEKVVNEIFECYINYFFEVSRLNKLKYNNLLEKVQRIENDPILSDIGKILTEEISNEIFLEEMPVMLQHGDLWLYNILLSNNDENTVYFIDWEHSGEYLLFYDVFWWMVNEALWHKDYSYIWGFLDGHYDHYFNELFKALNMKYHQEDRISYFCLFIVELLCSRVLDKNNDIKYSIKDIYIPFVIDIIGYKAKKC